MASFSRNDTFDRLKHYVGVRLQQGVPLIDADWNEMEDIRKFELQAFLKWVIGNGVPMGNTGFRIQPLSESGKHKIILTAEPLVIISQDPYKTIYSLSSLEVSGKALDFGQGSQPRRVQRIALPLAQLTSLVLYPDTNPPISGQLVISANDSEDLTVNFENVKKLSDVIDKINQQAKNQKVGLTASICGPDYFDFDITGGDDSFLGAGRCLVEGWDVMNECNIRYSGQTLYGRDGLAARWGVAKLPPLTQPQVIPARDFVFLDVWERLVEPDEDRDQLVNPDIGMESCLRLKREWVVRVLRLTDLNKAQDLKQNRARFDQYMRDMYTAEGVNTRERHAYYPLALLHWENQAAPQFEPLVEETGFNLAALAAEIAEARGIKGSLGNRLDVSLTKDGQLQEQVVGNDQVNANAPIAESKIQFSATGHNHSGGINGSQIGASGIAANAIGNDQVNANAPIAESKIQFSATGHDHSGGDHGKPIGASGITDNAVNLNKIKLELCDSGSVEIGAEQTVVVEIKNPRNLSGFILPPIIKAKTQDAQEGWFVYITHKLIYQVSRVNSADVPHQLLYMSNDGFGCTAEVSWYVYIIQDQ